MRCTRTAGLLALILTLAGCGGGGDGHGPDDTGPPPGDATPGDTGPGDAGADAAVDTGADTGPPGCEPTSSRLSPRGEHAAVYDEANERLIVYGGNAAAPIDCTPQTSFVADMWAFDVACGTWNELDAGGGPGPRARHAMVIDSSRDRILLFGGRYRAGASGSYILYNDVWAYDLGTGTWSQVTTTGTAPSPRSYPVAGYDAAKDRLIVFGGDSSTSGLTPTGTNDTFALDLATNEWSRLTNGSPPPPRYYHAATMHDGELVVFGGTPAFDGPFRNDVWTLDLGGDVWRQTGFGGATAPETRFGGGLFSDAANGRLVMIGGHDSTSLGNRNDAWQQTVVTGAWTRTVAGDTLNGTGGFCSFPADFTIPDLEAPERRSAFAYAQGATTGWLVGGKTDCGNSNDVWAVDLATGTYSLVGPSSTEGEACNRSGATSCTELCF